jgi:hypothetical protein
MTLVNDYRVQDVSLEEVDAALVELKALKQQIINRQSVLTNIPIHDDKMLAEITEVALAYNLRCRVWERTAKYPESYVQRFVEMPVADYEIVKSEMGLY